MDEREILDDCLAALSDWVHDDIAGLSIDDLAWQPDPLANGVGVTVWHLSRWLDVLAVQALAGRSAADEHWQTGPGRRQERTERRGGRRRHRLRRSPAACGRQGQTDRRPLIGATRPRWIVGAHSRAPLRPEPRTTIVAAH
jgi:hypothetical protein